MNIKSIDYDSSDVDTQAITSNILTPNEPEVDIPSDVISAINDQIKQLKTEVEQDGGTAIQRDTQVFSNQQEFLIEVIDKLQILHHELSKQTLDGLKRAQIMWAQIPNYMWKYVPVVVSQFLYRAKASKGETLIGAFYTNKPFQEQK